MGNPEHLAKLKEGVEAWNQWREENVEAFPDLREAKLAREDLRGLNLQAVDLRGADLYRVNLCEVDLRMTNLKLADLREAKLALADLRGAELNMADLARANLSRANLSGAQLIGSTLIDAILSEANLCGADLIGADLIGANLSGANLNGANLSAASLVDANLEGANLTACTVYGVSVWNVKLEGAIQSNLVITPLGESPIQVDNLEVAQFIYLLLNNQKIRHVIETITSKVVLILGRFSEERKPVLEAIREELRKRDYLPVLFDFEKPNSKDFTGTIFTLANMARFIIADLTDPSSVPYELGRLVPNTKVPVQAIILEGQQAFAMFVDLKSSYHWVLEPHPYKSQDLLIAQLSELVIAPAEAKAKELVLK